jgi:hypothetical protein
MAYADLAAELTGVLPGLSPFLADTFINRAWRKIRDRRLWSFLIADAAVVCPVQVATGTFAITKYSVTAVGNAAARAALLAVDIGLGAGALSLVKLQIRFMGGATTSQIYNILQAVDTNPTITLTLDRGVQEATTAVSVYLVYRAYIIPPVADFSTWISLDDMVNGIRIVGNRLTYTSSYFDLRDPQRQALGQSFLLGLYKGSAVVADNSAPIYELWPGCTMGQTWYTRYRRRGVDFTLATDTQPALIPDELIIDTALLHFAYPYCQANQGHFPAMKGINWATIFQEKRLSLYGNPQQGIRGALRDAIIADDNEALQSVWNRGHGLKARGPAGFYGPIDSNYIQSHPVTW